MPKETAPTPAKKHSRRDNPWRNSESIGIRAILLQEEAEKNTNLLGDPAPRSSQLERNAPFSRDESRACLASQQQAKKSPFPTFWGLGVEESKGEVESKQLKPLNTLSVDRGRIYVMLEYVRDTRFVEHHTF